MSYPHVELRATIPTEARTWRNELGVRRWSLSGDLISDQEHEAWCKRVQSDPTTRVFGIWARDNRVNGFVGVCSLSDIDFRNQRARFSIYVAVSLQRFGYGRYALCELLDYGFNELNLNSIYGECLEGNPANELFKKLGAKHQGILFDAVYRRGRFQNLSLWAFLRKDLCGEQHPDRSRDGDQCTSRYLKPYFSTRERTDVKPSPLAEMAARASAERFDQFDGIRLRKEAEEGRGGSHGAATDSLSVGSANRREGTDETGS